MTMPHLMNCSHQPEGRCKECEEAYPAPWPEWEEHKKKMSAISNKEFTREDAENWLINKGIIKKDMKKKTENGLRMYFFVMYNLSGIQKGIQAGHAALEYAKEIADNRFGDEKNREYKEFIENHKTFILLCGGGSQDMLDRERELDAFGISFASFKEPDLNDSISAIAFIVPESVYGFDEELFLETSRIQNYEIGEERNKYEQYKWLKSFRLASN